MGRITNRGIMWELLNSWWMFLAFIPYFGCLSILYIGNKVRKKLWTIIGLSLLTINTILLVAAASSSLKNTVWGAMGHNLGILMWGIGIGLSFIYRKEFLIRLDMLQKANIRQVENDNLRDRVAEELLQKGIAVNSPGSRETKETMDAEKEEYLNMDNIIQSGHNESHALGDEKPIDINLCSIESLSELPGITMILAKKAIDYRKENNGFTSVEEFYKVIELKPHFIAQIDNRLICNKPADSTRSADNSQVGRNLDL